MDRVIVEMEYSSYVAKEELFDALSEISLAYDLPNLTTEQVEQLNEMVLSTVGVYITKVTAGIKKAWADFKAGFQGSMWQSYKKLHEPALSSSASLTIEDEVEFPKIDLVEEFLSQKIPEWDIYKEKPIDTKADFYKQPSMKPFKHLYDENKTTSDIIDGYYFVKQSNTKYESAAGITVYTKFMDGYGSKLDKIAADIQSISVSAKETQAEAEKAQEQAKKKEEKRKQDEEKAKKEAEEAKAKEKKEQEAANKEAEQAKADADAMKQKAADDAAKQKEQEKVQNNSAVFNMANYFIECLLLEADEEKKEDSTEKDDGDAKPLSDKDYESKITRIQTFYSVCAEILSAKMKTLNKSRQIAFDVIKKYVNAAEKAAKELKKENKKKEKENRKLGIETEKEEEKK